MFTIISQAGKRKLLSNPLLIATKGKGFLPMLRRGGVIARRYGLSSSKIDHSLALLVKTLRQYASSATIQVTASALASNPSAASIYSRHGLELAIHGLYHVDHSRLSLEHQLDHLQRAREIFRRLHVPVSGFRCPYLRWNRDTLTALTETGFVYDSSQALTLDVVGGLATDAYLRVLEFYGAKSAERYPALPGWSDRLIRVPYCLPDDEALVERLHITDARVMAEIWLAMLDQIYQQGELFTLGLHPERASVCKAALVEVLAEARSRSPGVWVARLDEIAAWFQALRDVAFELHPQENGRYRIKIAAPDRATVLVRSIHVQADTQPESDNCQKVSSNEFTLMSDKRPIIGLAPGSPVTLLSFLRAQGYLAEFSPDAQAYGFYFNRPTFNPEDERPLLNELERGNWPVIRLSRWPDSARCGLAITGDVDAFSIWDYAKRFMAE